MNVVVVDLISLKPLTKKKKKKVLMHFSFNVYFLWRRTIIENLCFSIRFLFYVCLLYDNFPIYFTSSTLELLKALSSFSLFVFKFLVMTFFLLFSDKQQSNITVLPKLLLNRWWQILYCRRLLLQITLNDFQWHSQDRKRTS